MKGVKFLRRCITLLLSGIFLTACGVKEETPYQWEAQELVESTQEGNQEELKRKEEAYKGPTLANPGETDGKEIVTLGVTFRANSELLDMVNAYNKQSEDYYVQILVYEREIVSQYRTDLVMGKGTDLYELSAMSMEQLTQLGVLEDLSSYFAESEELQLDTLLPCVRKLGTVGEKIVGLAPEFYLLGLVTEKGIADNGAWTVEEFLDLPKKYPAARLTNYDKDPVSIILNVLEYVVEERVDWEKKTCDFHSDSFRKILERLYENSKRECVEETAANQAETLFKHERMVLNVTIGDPWAYAEVKEAFGDFGEVVGYPSEEGKPVYRLYANHIFGINSASGVKDGAWDFLEYWLSEEIQYATWSFPARSDVFENMISQDVSPRYTEKGYTEEYFSRVNYYTGEKMKKWLRINDEDRTKLREMLEHAEFANVMHQSFLQGVLFEELQAYFAGDKSVKAVMDIIQNRISLYLMESE